MVVNPQFDECFGKAILNHPAAEQTDIILETALANDHGTGVSVAVVINGELVFKNAYGIANRKNVLAPNALMRTGSVSKIFTAVAAARLNELGMLMLNQPVATLIPEYQNLKVTPTHLGTHTSGIRHYNFGKFSEANNRKRYPSLSDALELFIDDPLLFDPGTRFHYSSFGFNLLGVVIERAFGTTYAKALNELIAQPLSLTSLQVDDHEKEISCRPSFNTLAFGRIRITAPWRDNSDYYPSGGLLISASDLAIFVDAIFNSDFLQPETKDIFTTPVSTSDGELTGYSFGWQIGQAEDGKYEWYGHGGQTNGAYATARYYPDMKMSIVGMTNYNYWLTRTQPDFFIAMRKTLPALFQIGS